MLTDYRAYLEHERRLRPQTVKAYILDLEQLSEWAGRPLVTLTTSDVRAYMRHMSKRGLSTATIRRRVYGFTTFWEWLRLEGHDVNVITDGLNLPKLRRPAPRWLSVEQLRTFATTPAPGRGRLAERNTLAMQCLAWFGLRRGELLAVRVEDVRLDTCEIVVRDTKNGEDRILHIPPALWPSLREYIGARRLGLLFPSSTGRKWAPAEFALVFNRHVDACGLGGLGITPHVLRHTWITHMIQAGVPLATVSQLAGHKDVKSTMHYYHHSSQAMQEAMAKHPLAE